MVRQKSGEAFTSHNHTQAWRLFKVRPRAKAKQPENTQRDFCIYHAAHGDYTYSDKWVDHLVEQVKDADKFASILSVKLTGK